MNRPTPPGSGRAPLEPVVLSGRHVRLEPLEPGHAHGLLGAASGPRDTFTYTWVPDPDLDEVRRYIDIAAALHAAGTVLAFATIASSTGEVAGSTRFLNAEYWSFVDGRPSGRTGLDAVEIGGTWLAAAHQRTALNTEAKLLMLDHAFGALGVRRVTLKTDARNERSRRNIERVGATFEGILRCHQYAADGGIRDSAMYSILAAEWPERREALRARLRD